MQAPQKNWTYDFDDGRIMWDGGFLNVRISEAVIFGLLDKAYPHKVHLQKLCRALWPPHMIDADRPADEGNQLSVCVSAFRRRLADARAPFRIPHATDFGLWIEVIASCQSLPPSSALPPIPRQSALHRLRAWLSNVLQTILSAFTRLRAWCSRWRIRL